MYWDLLIIALALYNCVSIPFEVAFRTSFTNHWSLKVINYIIDFLFFFDIVVNFRTTYINQKTGSEVTSAKKIAIHYIFAGRFWIDLLASIPFELIFKIFLESVSSGQI